MTQQFSKAQAKPKLTIEFIYQQLSLENNILALPPDKRSLKDNMFIEIVRRSIADVSGHLNLGSQADKQADENPARVTIGKVYNIISHALKEKGLDANAALQFFLGNISAYSKGIVQTPHPTEMLGKKAIEAERELLRALEQQGKKLFYGKKLEHLEPEERGVINLALNDLYEKLVPVTERLSIEDEITRSILFSQQMFDAVPMIANRILTSANKLSTELNEKERAQFAHLVEPLTWSPGDQDSKPDMTIEELNEGFHKNRRTMLKHYAKHLIELADRIYNMPGDLQGPIVAIAAKLLNSAKQHETRGEKQHMSIDEYVDDTTREWDVNTGTKLLPSIKQQMNNDQAIYEDKETLIGDLEKLRALDAAHPPAVLNFLMQLNGDGEKQYMGILDALIIQAHNFGLNALSSQIRQNRVAHEKVFKKLLGMLPEEDLAQLAKNPDGTFQSASVLEFLFAPEHATQLEWLRKNVKITLEDIGNLGSFEKQMKTFFDVMQSDDLDASQKTALCDSFTELFKKHLEGVTLTPENFHTHKDRVETAIIWQYDKKSGNIVEKLLKDARNIIKDKESVALEANKHALDANKDTLEAYKHALKANKDALDAYKTLSKDWSKDLSKAREAKKEDDFYLYQTMKSLEFATRHPDFIPHYLIAECGYNEDGTTETEKANQQKGVEDMLSLLVMLKVMEPKDVTTPVEIVPLVEHPEQVLETYSNKDENGTIPYVEMMKQVFSNEAFREHHQKVSDVQYTHLLKHTTVDQVRQLTGSDILASVNPEFGVTDKDGKILLNKDGKPLSNLEPKDTPVSMAKLCMGAGSDITKFGGITAAALMQNAMFRLKEELASMEHPVLLVDYIGCGGGVHRTQPVSNSVETMQGRSMRQTADAIATKVTALLARNIRDRLVTDPTEKSEYSSSRYSMDPLLNRLVPVPAIRTLDRADPILAQLNLGNMANLPRNPTLYREVSRPIIQKAVRNYLEYTNAENHPEFNQLLSFSGDMFCKLTSFAARPGVRVDSKKVDDSFPPQVVMDVLRAIGYGGAVNVSGSSASLYLGIAEALEHVDKDQLMKAYKYDPLLQDALNRPTYGIAMADLDTAWRYVGEEKTPNKKILNQCNASNPSSTDRLALARKSLAHATFEYYRLGKKLIELHSNITRKPPPDSVGYGSISETLTNLLPAVLRYQLQTSRENIKAPREKLADIFQEQMKQEAGARLPIEHKDEKYKEEIYPAMGAIFECSEHTPRAYTSPYWAAEQSKASNLAMAA